MIETRFILTDVQHEIAVSGLAVVVVHVSRRENMRWSLDEHDIPAFHIIVGGRSVNNVRLTIQALGMHDPSHAFSASM